eukprot:scaffold518_cov388-Prasinococcus_capsulatus_cf.AAC.53
MRPSSAALFVRRRHPRRHKAAAADAARACRRRADRVLRRPALAGVPCDGLGARPEGADLPAASSLRGRVRREPGVPEQAQLRQGGLQARLRRVHGLQGEGAADSPRAPQRGTRRQARRNEAAVAASPFGR